MDKRAGCWAKKGGRGGKGGQVFINFGCLIHFAAWQLFSVVCCLFPAPKDDAHVAGQDAVGWCWPYTKSAPPYKRSYKRTK